MRSVSPSYFLKTTFIWGQYRSCLDIPLNNTRNCCQTLSSNRLHLYTLHSIIIKSIWKLLKY